MAENRSTCPVCAAKCTVGAISCERCDYRDDSGIVAYFADVADAEEWLEEIVKPYRKEWQLRELMRQNGEFMARLDVLESRYNTQQSTIADLQQKLRNQHTEYIGLKKFVIDLEKKVTPSQLAPIKSENTSIQSTKYKHGDPYKFGKYDWRILDVQQDKLLIITEEVITRKAYHSKYTAITWGKCDLRNKYLKTEFYNSFNESEKEQILLWDNKTKPNRYGTTGKSSTQDYIFLLSLEEVIRYFGDSGNADFSEKRANKDTNSISDNNNGKRQAKYGDSLANWWLRSPGYYGSKAAIVNSKGHIYVYGTSVNYSTIGVRPALWLKL